jgi:methylmalonyl-CoA mutase
MQVALFAEFPPSPDTSWDEQLRKELRGASFEDKLLWSPADLPAELEAIRPYYRRGDDAPHPLPPTPPFRYRACWDDPAPPALLHAAEQAASRDAAGVDIGLPAAQLKALLEACAGKAALPLRGFSTDLPADAAEGLLLDLAGYRARTGGAADSLGEAAWDRLAAHVKAAPQGAQSLYLDSAVFDHAGADLVSSLAACWSALHETADALTARGICPAHIAGALVIRVAVGPNFFAEIARLRALRIGLDLLFQGLEKAWDEANNGVGSAAQPGAGANAATGTSAATPEILATASSWNLARSDRHNNLLRLCTESAAAMLGGAHALSLPRFDRGSEADSDFSRRITDNLNLLLQRESHLLRVDDPAAGSWYIEALTDQIGQAAWQLVQEAEAKGGFTACLQSGFWQERIRQARQHRAEAMQKPGSGWIGVTRFRPTAAAAASNAAAPAAPAPTPPAAPTSSSPSWEPITPWSAEAELSPAEQPKA